MDKGDVIDLVTDISYVDYTLYYQLFDNALISIDLGLTARDLEANISLTGPTIIKRADCYDDRPETPCMEENPPVIPRGVFKTDSIEPMLYLATDISLPLIGLSLFAQGDFAINSDHSISDYQVGLNYDLIQNMMMDLNVTLGYRTLDMEIEEWNGLHTDLQFKGLFAGIVMRF